MSLACWEEIVAEGEGFEPPLPVRVKRFSRPPVSTTHTSLRGCGLDKDISQSPNDSQPVQQVSSRAGQSAGAFEGKGHLDAASPQAGLQFLEVGGEGIVNLCGKALEQTARS
jgi:hypothetical protein